MAIEKNERVHRGVHRGFIQQHLSPELGGSLEVAPCVQQTGRSPTVRCEIRTRLTITVRAEERSSYVTERHLGLPGPGQVYGRICHRFDLDSTPDSKLTSTSCPRRLLSSSRSRCPF